MGTARLLAFLTVTINVILEPDAELSDVPEGRMSMVAGPVAPVVPSTVTVMDKTVPVASVIRKVTVPVAKAEIVNSEPVILPVARRVS